MISVSLAEVRAHLARLLATALAIVIAVGFVVATLVLNASTKATVYRAVAAPYLNSAVVVTPSDHGEPVSLAEHPEVARAISGVQGVRALTADATGYQQVKTAAGKGFRYAQVTAVADDPGLRWQKMAAGRLPTQNGEVAIGERRGISVGSTVTLLITDSTPNSDGVLPDPVQRTAVVTGLVDLQGAVGASGSQQVFATTAQAKAWSASEVDAIRVAAQPRVDASVLSQRISTVLHNDGLVVRTGDEQAEVEADAQSGDAAGITTVLLVFAAVAVLVCGLVISNTFAVLLAQRTRELALLRCIGATSRQLRHGVLVESLVIGAASAAVGVLAGIGGATGIAAIAGHLNSPIPLDTVSVPLSAVGIGLLIGIAITVVAAFLPARRATRVAPLAALRPMDDAPLRSRAGLARRLVGLGLLIPSAAVLALGSTEGDLMIALAGGLVSFVAVVLLARWVVPPVVGLAGRLTGPAGGVPGRLAAANSIRNPQRTAATATALIIGVTLTTTMVVGAASTRATTTHLLDDHFPTDVVVQGNSSTPLPAGLVGSLAAVPHVAATIGLTTAQVKGPDGETYVLGVDVAQASKVVRSGEGAGLPAPGTISVAPDRARAWGGEGARVRLTNGSRSVSLRLHEVPGDQTGPRMTSADLARLAPKAGIGAVWLKLTDGLDADGRADALDAIGSTASEEAPSTWVQGAAEERDGYDRIINTLLLIVTGLLAIAVVIAVIGVGNTLALSVVERRQESGLLRALGLTRGQLRWMLLWEAVLIAGVATVLGVVLGGVYGALGTSAALSGAGAITIAVPWTQVLLIVLVATAAGALASVLPSRRAARISPVAALAA